MSYTTFHSILFLSYAGGMALQMAESSLWVSRSLHHIGPGGNISQTTGEIAMKFCTDIIGDFGDPLAFPVVLQHG